MKNFLLILFIITSSLTWAGPVLNTDSCEDKTAEPLYELKQVIHNFEKHKTFKFYTYITDVGHINASDATVRNEFLNEVPDYVAPRLFTKQELLHFLKATNIRSALKLSGHFSGLYFQETDNGFTAKLTQHRDTPRESTDIDSVRLRLLPDAGLSAIKTLMDLGRISQVNNISIELDLTFKFDFKDLKDTARFIYHLKNLLKQNSIKTQKIPFALDVGSGIYIGGPEISSEILQRIKNSEKDCDEECILKFILKVSKYDFYTGLYKDTDINIIKEALHVSWPPFAPSPEYQRQLGDLSSLPQKVRERILHMAATQEGLTIFNHNLPTYNESLQPKDELLRNIFSEMVRLMADPKEIGIFLSDLMRETALLIQAEGSEHAKRELKKGIFVRKYVYKILAQWNAKEGLPPFHVMRSMIRADDLPLILKKGLFIDMAFANSAHGKDVHIMQMMYLAHRLTPKFGSGAVRKFIDYIAESPGRGILWYHLVDAIDGFAGDYYSPEVFTPLFTPYLLN